GYSSSCVSPKIFVGAQTLVVARAVFTVRKAIIYYAGQAQGIAPTKDGNLISQKNGMIIARF
ncbi:MAG: hypothetical protein KAH48_12555, partial [Chlorobi bacterium]|nr:hypothetical protein [Chlorobiota bacterium]